jgi:RHS repeat-associated protein
VFASTSSAPAYSYDSYGNALQTIAPVTDFNYAGMFYNADSGLYLTQYRVYDPVAGRWLSRDPIGEIEAPTAANSSVITQTSAASAFLHATTGSSYRLASRQIVDTELNSATNLYVYVGGNPISTTDFSGQQWPQIFVAVVVVAVVIPFEWVVYLTHESDQGTAAPQPPQPPQLPPSNSCNAAFPQGVPPPEVRTYTPITSTPAPPNPEPPEPPEWPY